MSCQSRALDEAVRTVHPWRVSRRFATWCLSALLTHICCAPAFAQAGAPGAAPAGEEAVVPEDPVTPDVSASAVAAVSRLGEQVVLGRYQVAIEKMNPDWKARAANRMGDMKALERQIAAVAAEMVRQGISMISFKPQGAPIVHQVDAGARADGSFGYRKWLVLVPTATRFRILHRVEGGPPRSVTIEKIGFQVAISDKGKNDWTFIDGAGLRVGDLRGLYPTLPLDMPLPPTSEREIR